RNFIFTPKCSSVAGLSPKRETKYPENCSSLLIVHRLVTALTGLGLYRNNS
ncbi:unnamed protein product, partial [Ascophyllum nodosum]